MRQSHRPDRRPMLALMSVLGIAAAAVGPSALAQDYPNKPVKLIVSFPPGSGADTTARHYAKRLPPTLRRRACDAWHPGIGPYCVRQ